MSALSAAVDFVRGIGIETTYLPGATGFLDGIRIVGGMLLVDPDCTASSVLHEAGHIALMPPRWRPLMRDDISGALDAMFGDMEGMELHPDSALHRAAIQCSDPEATAWAWAAGVAAGIDPEEIIQDDEYDKTGAEIRTQLLPSITATRRVSSYLGIHGLAHAGFCSLSDRGPYPMYPKMAKWLQDATP